jgi:hypothetical protein
MSSNPFVPITTPNIERSNRLLSLRTHPGFNDLLRIIQEMIAENVKICVDYPGWDPQVITVLKVRMQAAYDMHAALQVKINEAIQLGVEEQANHTNLNEKTAEEIIEQSDLVRQEVLTRFSQMDNETRAPGSY